MKDAATDVTGINAEKCMLDSIALSPLVARRS